MTGVDGGDDNDDERRRRFARIRAADAVLIRQLAPRDDTYFNVSDEIRPYLRRHKILDLDIRDALMKAKDMDRAIYGMLSWVVMVGT